MKHFLTHTLAVLLFALSSSLSAAQPVKIIFDTDLGNDADDAMAMAVAYALQSRGELEVLAVTTTKDNPHVAPMADLLNTFYGQGSVPIGVVEKGVTPEDGKYNAQVLGLKTPDGKPLFARTHAPDKKFPEAVSLIRKTLSEQEDRSVVVLQIGFFTNMQRLLETSGDDYSPLSGLELVRKKVKYASIMAGAFVPRLANHREYNVVKDIPAARKMIEKWPTEIVFSGFEIGETIKYPVASIQNDFEYVPAHPVKEAYRFYRSLEKDQPTYDLNSVLQIARPDRGYYTLSEPGIVRFDEKGLTTFTPDPNGKHRYQIVDEIQKAVVREALLQLTSQPVVKPGK